MMYDPNKPDQDCSGFECMPPAVVEKQGQDCYIEPATIWTMWRRLPEIITDAVSNQLSGSRFGLVLMNVVGAIVTIWACAYGRFEIASGILVPIAATDAGVYFASTVKDWRWRRRDKEEGL